MRALTKNEKEEKILIDLFIEDNHDEFYNGIDLERLEYFKRQPRGMKKDLLPMQKFIRDNFDPKCEICGKCPRSLNWALARIKKWDQDRRKEFYHEKQRIERQS